MDKEHLKTLGLAVIDTEITGIENLRKQINDGFAKACEIMMTCEGRIVVTGMGKSGHIGSKIAATLASTGSPAFFVHPGEASHGDLGMITKKDVVLALSNSGETGEILTILPIIKRLGAPLISITGNPNSTLATTASVNLDGSVEKEACPLGLAPTTSTTVALVLGDALAIALLEAKGFTAEDFALSHPGGSLGRRLLLHVADIMHTKSAIPAVHKDDSLKDALLEMSKKGLGMTAIIESDQSVIGIYTDGDLRRTLDKDIDIHTAKICDVMTTKCKTLPANILAAEALNTMQQYSINDLLIVDDNNKLIGALNMQDMLRAGVI